MKKLVVLFLGTAIVSSIHANHEVHYVEHHHGHHDHVVQVKKPISPTIIKGLISGTLAVGSGLLIAAAIAKHSEVGTGAAIAIGVIGAPTCFITTILTLKYIVQLAGQLEQRATSKD